MLSNVGFHVYGPVSGNVYATGGAQPGMSPNVSGNLISTDRGHYVVQVCNYDPSVPISYAIALVQGTRQGRLGAAGLSRWAVVGLAVGASMGVLALGWGGGLAEPGG